ncbi:MAG: hypothetical protein JNJ88_19930 [Planctomycetes bacterium]|nr:hypothetical protein [Planctomycetota bacterium]
MRHSERLLTHPIPFRLPSPHAARWQELRPLARIEVYTRRIHIGALRARVPAELDLATVHITQAIGRIGPAHAVEPDLW